MNDVRTTTRWRAVVAAGAVAWLMAVSAIGGVITGPGGSGVPVGGSALLSGLDYSDSFTLTANGGIPGRVVNAYPVGAPGINVESNHGNTPRAWTNAMWSVSAGPNAINGATIYPGDTGAGSATGMTQRGGGVADWGIEYGLRSDFVVQTDFVQTSDRVDISIGGSRDTFRNTDGVAVFFRRTGHPSYPEIGLFSQSVGERSTGLTSGIPAAGPWHNYAVRFNTTDRVLEIFVDEVSRGSVDLDTVAGGAFAGVTLSNAAVSVGYSGNDRGWSDNFQVGPGVSKGVRVGASTLIDTLDYSDSFTLTAKGGNPGRTANAYPINAPGISVEDNHGNSAQTWTNAKWSISGDPYYVPGNRPYPGGSGAGSATGITQRGDTAEDWGLEYGLRRDFVVQTDFVQTTDRVDITAGSARDTIGSANGLSVFFRQTGHPSYPEIGIYSPGIGERDTGLPSGIAAPDEWHNYAVRFDMVHRQLEVFVDQVSRGTINLDTVGGGAFSRLAVSNQAVSAGYAGAGNRGWSDNFQVGAPPGEVEMLPQTFTDYSDTFTVGTPARPDGLYNNNSGGGYNVENTHGYPAATWTPFNFFSFNSAANSTNPTLLGAAGGNPGAATGVAQSGGGDFSFAYGLRSDYIVSLDAILPPNDRLDISSLPFPGASIFTADSLSVFFRRDSVTGLPAIGLYNGATETGVLAPGTLGIDDADWHNFAVWFDQLDDELKIFVDQELVAALDLTTFAGGIYQSYSNAAVGAGGAGYNWGYPGGPWVLWVDNFQVGVRVPEPATLALLGAGLVALARRRRRRA